MEPTHSNSLKDYLAILFKRKGMILIFLFATVLTAAIGAKYTQKVLYEAHLKLLIESDRGYVSGRSLPTNDQKRMGGGLNSGQQIDLALQVLSGNSLARGVVDKIGPTVIYEDLADISPGIRDRLLMALGWQDSEEKQELPIAEIAALKMQSDLIAMRTGQFSSIIYIGFRHENPALAADVVNTVADLYLEHNLRLHKKPRLTRFFQGQFDVKKKELTTAEHNLKEFKERHGITATIEAQKSLIMKQRATHQTQLDEASSQEAELSNQYRQLSYQLADTASPQVISTLRDKLFELQLKEDRLASQYIKDNSEILNLRKEIQGVRHQLDGLGYEKPITLIDEDDSLYIGLQGKTLQAEMDVKVIKARNVAMQANLAEYDDQLKKLDNLEAEFNHLQEQLSIAQNSFRLYQMKFEEFRISDALDAEGIGNVKVLDPARAPLVPAPSKTTLILLLSLFFGSFGGIGLAFFLELISGTLNKREEVEQYLQRPVLATIPEIEFDREKSGIGGAVI